jgi:AbiV family abortive infection protein
MSKAMPVPDLDALGDLAITAAKNSRRLLDDADLLLKRGRWPTAYSVAVLAFEEAGKAWLCVIAMMIPGDDREDYPFAGMIGAHLDKLMAAHAMAHMHAFIKGGDNAPKSMIDVGVDVEMLAREQNRAKQRGLYADLTDGVIWSPDQVTKSEAARMVAIVRGLLDHGGYLADPEFMAWLGQSPEEVRSHLDAFWGRFISGWQLGGPEGMAAAEDYMDEIGAIEGLREMMQEEDARHLAERRAVKGRRAQPRRPTRRSRRRH